MDSFWMISTVCLLLLILLVWVLWRYYRLRNQINKLFNHLSLKDIQLPSSPASLSAKLKGLQELIASLYAQSLQSERDKLTELDNRLSMKRKMAAMMPLDKGSLVLLDIYRFRYVNDLFGFNFGDELLKQIAARVRSLAPEGSLIARMNEDEFLIYFTSAMTEPQLQQLIDKLQLPYDIFGSIITTRVQMGHLALEPFHSDISTMLRRLDLALKKAKTRDVALSEYLLGDDAVQLREVSIINSLAKALRDGELYMVYQPKQSIPQGDCHQVEALMRWQHPLLGKISPAEFIPLAEYSGMIDIVSQWVLDEVFAQQAQWLQSGIKLQVAVNLSTQDLRNASLITGIEARLEQYKFNAEMISIEITESKLMQDLDGAVATIKRLRQIGVDVAIDDFGTGHSSLAYLKYLPVDEVKIDKAFLDDLDVDDRARHIMDTSIRLAKGLGFKVTVEGVETEDVLQLLLSMGVDKIQGDIFSKPLTAKELESRWAKISKT
ncbi:bifunctional diguanylate cyclase/phosphodiesterase [Shewanella schlegeliana]|uniref:Bifunctional diguanylate cyclase/phosphodiesterase n=1 Tax=Shewanella schlegeliana TaxID=190308 RepID=A0ABS1SYE8_9GAMM|nr:bifunctional diguanylate cyclase/phosphodiesterase [Shewanella schlegeliana]MBL4913552.1 bifunctional diguanylate cyclase/phosphodiesterase [Shewanella schlegeliana]MCL1108442.1 bifunctional diguanylate cyclase/phosphodiesterase [Shewanella schlegeliana]GIU28647.1 GGDEF-domain containing protein [Shewanella schlegeliana]